MRKIMAIFYTIIYEMVGLFDARQKIKMSSV